MEVTVHHQEDGAAGLHQLGPDVLPAVAAIEAVHLAGDVAAVADVAVGRQDRPPLRVGGEHLLRPVEGVVGCVELQVEQQEIHAAGAEQGVVVHVLPVDRVQPELVVAQVAPVGRGRRVPGRAGVPRGREVLLVQGRVAGGEVEVVVAGKDGVGYAGSVQHRHGFRGALPLADGGGEAHQISQVGHERQVEIGAVVDEPLGLLGEDRRPVRPADVVLRIRDQGERERVARVRRRSDVRLGVERNLQAAVVTVRWAYLEAGR